MIISRHYQSQPIAAAGEVPQWVHLIPAGVFRGVDGRGPYHVENAQALIEASMADGKITLDENHSTDLASPMGGPAPARGWIFALEAREDGIWGHVEWNESGRALMADRAYRGISPVFSAAKDGTLLKLFRAALTNNPNLNLYPLHSQEFLGNMSLAPICQALGLPETADEAAVLAAIATQKATVTAHAALQAQAADVQRMAAQVVALETELNTMKAGAAKAVATSFVDAAIREGKPVASLRDHYITRHMADPAAVEKEISALVSINAGGMAFPPKAHSDSGDDEAMSAEEHAVCEKMGLDKKAFVKQRNAAKKKAA